MSVYPSNVPTTGDLPDAGANLSSNPHSSLHDDVRDEVIAIAGELGVEPSGTESTVRARLDAGLGLREIVYFTSNGTFTKASYPWLRAVRVRVQGGGGGGGGAESTTSLQGAAGAGGAGGGYAELLIAASSLGSSETVTVGAAGSGASGASGSAGGNSSFGTLVVGNGGGAGTLGLASNAATAVNGPAGGTGTGDLVVAGEPGGGAMRDGNDYTVAGLGGSAVLGHGAKGFLNVITFDNGVAGVNAPSGYGGGGSGARNAGVQSTRAGGNGSAGIVIVELFA
jgi:hypothetical protein